MMDSAGPRVHLAGQKTALGRLSKEEETGVRLGEAVRGGSRSSEVRRKRW
jgi:hypothetical protein